VTGRLLRSAVLAALAVTAVAAGAEERIRVRVRAEPEEIRELFLEDYVAGVVSGEMPARFPAEALKAQAVAARSYALVKKIEAQAANRRWDIATGVLAQVFQPGESNAAARAAVAATHGEVLVLGMEPVEAYFHASCGGRTEGGMAALGRDLPYLAAAECGRCDRAPGAGWSVVVPAAELGRRAGLGGRADRVRVVSRTATGRAARVEVAAGRRKVTLAASDLRQRLGFSLLPSLAFQVRAEGEGFRFDGRGQGHGAGLCQWGAAGLAREGKEYREILGHYYPGADVVQLY
jgi:stage II sporulation protein D